VFKGLYGVKTGHTSTAGWCEVAAVRRNGVTLYTTVLGSPTRSQRNTDLAAAAPLGHLALPSRLALASRSYLSRSERGVRERLGPDRRRTTGCAAGFASTSRSSRVSPAPTVLELPVQRGERVGEIRIYSGRRLVARQPLLAARSVAKPGFGGRIGFYAGRTLTHVKDWFS